MKDRKRNKSREREEIKEGKRNRSKEEGKKEERSKEKSRKQKGRSLFYAYILAKNSESFRIGGHPSLKRRNGDRWRVFK